MTRSLLPRVGSSAAKQLSAAQVAELSITRSRVEEPREGEWSNSGEWGESYAGNYPKFAGQPTSVLSNSRIVGPPRVISLALHRPQLDRPEPNNADVYALIKFGSGAAASSILVDWRGVIAIPANTVGVSLLGYTPDGTAGYDPSDPTSLRVSATMGINGAPSSEPPTLTTPQFEVPANAAVELLVPAFARRVFAFVGQLANTDPLSLADFVVEAMGRNGQLLWSYELAAELLGSGLVLPGQARSVLLSNFSPYLVRMGAVFHLGL